MKRAMFILWPSFVVAGVAEIVFFTVFDPRELHLFGQPVEATRLAVYSLGFLLFWAFATGSSALTCYLQLDAKDVNR